MALFRHTYDINWSGAKPKVIEIIDEKKMTLEEFKSIAEKVQPDCHFRLEHAYYVQEIELSKAYRVW